MRGKNKLLDYLILILLVVPLLILGVAGLLQDLFRFLFGRFIKNKHRRHL